MALDKLRIEESDASEVSNYYLPSLVLNIL